jgi:hypothetical protein
MGAAAKSSLLVWRGRTSSEKTSLRRSATGLEEASQRLRHVERAVAPLHPRHQLPLQPNRNHKKTEDAQHAGEYQRRIKSPEKGRSMQGYTTPLKFLPYVKRRSGSWGFRKLKLY